MTQKTNRNTASNDNNPFNAFFNRLPPATMAFVVLVLVLGVMLLLSNSIDSTSSTRTMIVTDTVQLATGVATSAQSNIQPAQVTTIATVAATAISAK